MKPEHESVLDILQEIVEGKRDALKIIFDLARQQPFALMTVCEPAPNPHDSAAVNAKIIVNGLRSNNKVSAIKCIREVRKWGLKEAIDYVNGKLNMHGDNWAEIEKEVYQDLNSDLPF